ncbi:MAG: substrate-binding domain-containing protein [Acidobacteriota bacterium]
MTRLWMVSLLVPLLCMGCGSSRPTLNREKERITIGVMPKLKGISFFNAAERGAHEAGKELEVAIDFDGPVGNDVTLQAQLVESWIAKKYDAIAIAPNDPDAIAPVLMRARERGIAVVTWDADAQAPSRDYFVSQCTPESVAQALVDAMVQGAGRNANYVIITGSLTAANQNIWMSEMEKYRARTYPQLTNLSLTPKVSEEDQALATQVALDCLKTYPNLGGIFALTTVALPGAAEALRKAGASERVFLTGLSTPNVMKEYLKDGTVKRFVLWNPIDLGYLAVQVAVARVKGDLGAAMTTFSAGRLGEVKVQGDQVILGDPIVFDDSNIDRYDY